MDIDTLNKSRKDEWLKAKKLVAQLTDGLGMPVDKKIVDTVVVLQIMGFKTTMSCSGHLRRITGGPYVMFVAPGAEKYRERCKQIGDSKDAEYKRLHFKALQKNLQEQQKLYILLERFYAARVVPYGSRLTLRTLGFSTYRLDCQGAEYAHNYDRIMRKKLLLDNQAEMKEFTEYLKHFYFVKAK